MRIVLFHESPLSSRVYDATLGVLGHSLGAVAFDTPGYGMSDPPPTPRRIEEYADCFLKALEIAAAHDVILAGVHTGASLAISVAAQAPVGVVAGLALSGVGVMAPRRRQEMLATWAPEVNVDRSGEYLAWAWARYRRIYGDDAEPSMLNDGVAQLIEHIDRYHWAYNSSIAYDPTRDLRDLTQPILFLTPEHDMLAEGDSRALRIAVNAKQHIFRDLAGQPHIRVPAVFAAELLAFHASIID